ncbi:cobalamin-dependent protein [Streptomyces sp. NPDC047000]|uniref:cobalamin B12-binding domain-containing protein n=1 Tax=Streptomyces sp. NPDC047000 TaxID=3155474 RepID=UPI0033EA5FBD
MDVVLTTVASDSHTWNLTYLQVLLTELGHRVTNLGPCVPDEVIVHECCHRRPDLIVVCSVNGHGFHDGKRIVARLRSCPETREAPVVIGGSLGIGGTDGGARSRALRAAGFDEVFEGGAAVDEFCAYVSSLCAELPA